MLQFNNFSIHKEHHFCELTADSLLQLEHVFDEDYMPGTPKCWDDTLIKRIPMDDFDVYHICVLTIACGAYNRITDYKKIWGLQNIAPGIYDGQYDCSRGRVYLGITKKPAATGFRLPISSLMLLLPNCQTLDPEILFSLFRNCLFDFTDTHYRGIFCDMQNLIPNSLVLYYSAEQPTLSIWGCERDLFTLQDEEDWNVSESLAVYRMPINVIDF